MPPASKFGLGSRTEEPFGFYRDMFGKGGGILITIFSLLCLLGCEIDKQDRSAVNQLPQRRFDRKLWRDAAWDDAYRARVRYSMYKDVIKRTGKGSLLTDVLAEYGAPAVVMSAATAGDPDAIGRRERPAGTAFTVTYFIAQDRGANFGLNLTFCFDKKDRLIKAVEHW